MDFEIHFIVMFIVMKTHGVHIHIHGYSWVLIFIFTVIHGFFLSIHMNRVIMNHQEQYEL